MTSFAAGLATCCSKNSTCLMKSSSGRTGSCRPLECFAPFFQKIDCPRESAFKTLALCFHQLARHSTGSSSMVPLTGAFSLSASRRDLSLPLPVDLARLPWPSGFLYARESVPSASTGNRSGRILHHRMSTGITFLGRLSLKQLFDEDPRCSNSKSHSIHWTDL